MATLNPYLTFEGNCEEAFNFYKSVFGGEFKDVLRMSDAPPHPQMIITEDEKNNILHMSLRLDGESFLMGCDQPRSYGKVVNGSKISIQIQAKSREEADKLHNGLSEGDENAMPMSVAFWGDYFGMCKDKYGIQWMISAD